MIDFHLTINGQPSGLIPEVYDTATLQDNLEHSGGVTLSWKSDDDTEIPVGAYITYGGLRYILLEKYAPTREGNTHWKYDPTFKHPTNLLDRIPFWIKSLDAEGKPLNLRTTSFTGFPHTIAKKLCDFMAEYANETGDDYFAYAVGLEKDANEEWKSTWQFNIPTNIDKAVITVGFDGSTIKGAANSIADAMACNVFWDWNTKKMMFVSGTTIQGETYNCYHVLGGTANMGKNAYSGGFAAVTQRLTLREPADGAMSEDITIKVGGVDKTFKLLKGSIISAAEHNGIMLTKDLIFDDVYPKMELFIKTARQRECRLTDENGNFIVDHFEKNGQTVSPETEGATPIYKTFAKWYVTFSTDKTEWDKEHQTWEQYQQYAKDNWTLYGVDPRTILINDKPLGLLFQIDYVNPDNMSPLVGRQFDMTYFPDAKTEWDKNDVTDSQHPFQILAGEYYIAFTAEGDQILPTTSNIIEGTEAGLVPKAGDKVTLVNVALTNEESIAKDNLLESAKEIIGLMNTPSGEYSETVIFGQGEPRIPILSIGQESPFDKTKHGPVVTSINHNLDTDVAEVTVGAWSRKTRTGGTADKLETVTVSASTPTEGGDKIGGGEVQPYYGQKETNTIQQTQVKPDTLYTAQLSIPTTSVDCTWDGKVKKDTNLYTRVWAYYGTRNITDICNITLSMPLTGNITVTREPNNSTVTPNKAMVAGTAENLSDDRYWLRIFIPKDTDFTAFSDTLNIAFIVNHQYHGDREVTVGIDANRDGEDGIAGPFKSRVFARINTDISSVTPTGGSYNAPWVGGMSPCTQTYTIGGKQVQVTWSDGIPNGQAMLWSTVRTFHADGTVTQWSNPAPETDTATLDIEFSLSETEPSAPTGETPHSDHSSEGWYDPSLNQTLPTGKTWSDMIWRAERKISNGVYDGGWTITRIKGEKGADGGNAIRIDLDNEADMVAVDSTGKTRFARTITTRARIYDGGEVAASVQKDASLTPANMKIGSTSTVTVSNVVSGVVTITWSIAQGDSVSAVEKTISLVYKGQTYSAVFSFSAIDTDAIYQLSPSPSSVNFTRQNDNTLSPSSVSLNLSLVKYDGTSTSELFAPPTGYTVRWKLDSMPTGSTDGTQWNGGSTLTQVTSIASGTTNKNVCIALFYGTVMIDRESVPIVKDGTNGLNGEIPAMLFKSETSGTAVSKPTVNATNYMAGTSLGGWSKSAPNREAGKDLWMSQNIVLTAANGTSYSYKNASWSEPVKISGDKGDPGADSSDTEWIYIRTNTYSNPYSGTNPSDIDRGKQHGEGSWIPKANQYTTDDYVPEGWSDRALSTEENNKYVYASWRIKPKGENQQWGRFETPILWSNWGVEGIDGDGVQYMFKLYADRLTAAQEESYKPTKGTQDPTTGEWSANNSASDSTGGSWYDDPQTPTKQKPYCYCSAIKELNGTWGDFGKLGCWSTYSENVVRLDLDNEYDSIQYQGDGKTKIGGSVSTTAYLFDGTTDKSTEVSGVTFQVDTANTNIASSNYSLSGTNNRVLTVSGLHTSSQTAQDGYVTLMCTYNGTVYRAKFSVAALVNQDKYDLDVNPNALFLNTSDGWSASKSVTVKVMRTPAGGGTPEAVNPSTYGLVLSASVGTLGSYSSTTNGFTLTVTQAQATSNNDTVLSLYKSGDTSKVYDRETIPFNKAENGTSPWIADLDNEMDSIACDIDGKPAASTTVQTNLSLFYGSTKKSFKIKTVTINGSASKTGVTFNYPTTADVSRTFKAIYGTNATISGKDDIAITLQANDDASIERILHFTINGVRPGADGSPAVLYRLVPSCSEIVKKKNGGTEPSGNVTCSVTKSEGNGAPQTITTGFKLNAYIDGSTTPASSSTIAASSVNTKIVYELLVPASGGVIVDRETIPVVTDGIDGESVLFVDIDNDSDQFGTDSEGVTQSAQEKSTGVTLYYGTTPQTLTKLVATVYKASDTETSVGAATATVNGTKRTGYITISSRIGTVSSVFDGTDGTVTVSLNKNITINEDLIVRITAYRSTTESRTTDFTLKQVKSGAPGVTPDMCNLRPTSKSISFTKSEQAGDTKKILGCGYTLVTKTGTTNVDLIDGSVTVNGTAYYIYWRYVGGTYRKFTTSEAIYATGIAPNTTNTGVEFCLTSATAAGRITTANTLDYENVPILKDGVDGNRGDFKSTVFKRNTTAPNAPTGGSYDSPVPSGWSDGVPDGDAILWASACTFHGDGTSSGWSTPQQMTDTADFDVEFSSVANPNPPSGHPNTNTQWSNTSDSTTIWMATSECHNGVWSNWQVSKIKGEKGDSIAKDGPDTYRYALSTDGINHPTSGWSGTKPSSFPTDQWLWTETTIHWNDNSTTVLYTAERNPNDGVAGMDIVAGSTTIQYKLTQTNVQPTSGWGNYPSTLTPGWYLWSKATTPYYKDHVGGTSAGESVTYNVSYIATDGTDGKDGKDGANGRGISSITEYYQATNSNAARTKPSSASGWTTNPNVPSPYGPWNESKKYLWNMEETVYTNSDGTTTTDYSIPQILAIWTKDGAAGRGIDSIQNYYKITQNTTAPSKPSTPGTGGWSTTPTAPSQGEYLWNYEVITWVNGAPATTETAVQLIGHTGVDGINAVTISLDNQHEDFIYDDAGNNKTGTVSSQARLFDGVTDVTESATWKISDNNGSTWANTASTNANAGIVQTAGSKGKLNVSGLKASTVKIIVRAEYPTGKYYYTEFTANKTNQDKYDLVIKPNAISFNSATYSDVTLSISAKRTDLQGNQTTPTISPTINSGQLRLFMGYVDYTSAIVSLSRQTSLSPSISYNIASLYEGVYFELRWYGDSAALDTSTSYRLCDYETVEIAKAEDGAQGMYEVSEYGRYDSHSANASGVPSGNRDTTGVTRTSPIDSQVGWAISAPATTSTYRYIWKRTCVYNPATGDYSGFSYVCETGVEGLQGCVIRTSEWTSGQEYRNDDGDTSVTIGYIDVVGVEDSSDTYGYKFYRCKQTHTSSNSITTSNTQYWELLTNVGPIFTSFLVAKNAYIKFGTGNQFVITNDSNQIKAGMKGGGNESNDHGGIRIWAGSTSNSDLASAPFRVYNDGNVVMNDADIVGMFQSYGGLIRARATGLFESGVFVPKSSILSLNTEKTYSAGSLFGPVTLHCDDNNGYGDLDAYIQCSDYDAADSDDTDKRVHYGISNKGFFYKKGDYARNVGKTGHITIAGVTLYFKGGILTDVTGGTWVDD